jgi:hypothetical protein
LRDEQRLELAGGILDCGRIVFEARRLGDSRRRPGRDSTYN